MLMFVAEILGTPWKLPLLNEQVHLFQFPSNSRIIKLRGFYLMLFFLVFILKQENFTVNPRIATLPANKAPILELPIVSKSPSNKLF